MSNVLGGTLMVLSFLKKYDVSCINDFVLVAKVLSTLSRKMAAGFRIEFLPDTIGLRGRLHRSLSIFGKIYSNGVTGS